LVGVLHPQVDTKPRIFKVEDSPAVSKAKRRAPVSYEIYEVTAYTSGPESTGKHPGDEGYGITTSGNHVKEGLTVSCPQELALGTVINIEGVGRRECQDRGSAIKGKRLDLYIADLDKALEFGRRTLKVHIVTK
jgi:3D (Asp-Asp-Asp) domain-containing protein